MPKEVTTQSGVRHFPLFSTVEHVIDGWEIGEAPHLAISIYMYGSNSYIFFKAAIPSKPVNDFTWEGQENDHEFYADFTETQMGIFLSLNRCLHLSP
jgi:hypothetical protein